MVQKLRSHAVEQEEEFFYLPKLYVGPDPKPTEPTERVYVVGNIQLEGNIIVPDGGTIGQAAGPLLTFDDTLNYLEITGCDVGIGTATPGAKLDVVGAGIRNTRYNNAAFGAYQDYYHARGTQAIPLIVQDDDQVSRIFFNGYDGAGTFSSAAAIYVEIDGVPGVGDMPGRLIFKTTPAGSVIPADRLTILSDGNVGISVSAPLGKLHIDQATSDAAIPVLILDQADISEGFINFIGSDRGAIAGATNSAVSVRAELGGTVYRLALYADA